MCGWNLKLRPFNESYWKNVPWWQKPCLLWYQQEIKSSTYSKSLIFTVTALLEEITLALNKLVLHLLLITYSKHTCTCIFWEILQMHSLTEPQVLYLAVALLVTPEISNIFFTLSQKRIKSMPQWVPMNLALRVLNLTFVVHFLISFWCGDHGWKKPWLCWSWL